MADEQNGKERKSLRVVIASPSDVLAEREIALQALSRVNELLKRANKNYYLEPVDHRSTVPRSDNPQKVVQEHLKIKQSDFFVCILGYRFGSPPGTRRPEDDTLYLSGTEEEFDTACKARTENANYHPRIMIYRKKDPLPEKMAEDDIRQYSKLLDFFDECGPNGKHPAYVAEFTTNDLENLLIDHFWQACSEMEKEVDRWTISSYGWYHDVGLGENPFSVDLLSRGSPEEYTVPFAGIDWQQYRNLLENINPIFIFGERGSGKSTLREMLKLKANQSTQDRKIVVCSLRAGHFDNFIERAGGKLSDFKDWVFAYMIFDKVVNNLVGSSKVSSQPGLVDVHLPSRTLQDLMEWLKQNTEYRRLLVLVDELDEIKLVKDSSQPTQAVYELLRQMVLLPQVDNIFIRYFLPAKMEALMEQDQDRFRLEKNRPIRLIWDDNKLLELLSQRMSGASIPKGHITSLSQVYCSSQGTKSIDMELVQLAESNPRALLWLASRLLEIHKLQPAPLVLIQQTSLEKVKSEWESERLKYFPPKPPSRHFEPRDNGVFFHGKEYHLSKTHARLLACLINAYGSFCDRNKLKSAGWPSDQVPVSDKNFYETMGHLVKTVDKFAPNWLISERGRGYKLQDPQSEHGHQEETTK